MFNICQLMPSTLLEKTTLFKEYEYDLIGVIPVLGKQAYHGYWRFT